LFHGSGIAAEALHTYNSRIACDLRVTVEEVADIIRITNFEPLLEKRKRRLCSLEAINKYRKILVKSRKLGMHPAVYHKHCAYETVERKLAKQLGATPEKLMKLTETMATVNRCVELIMKSDEELQSMELNSILDWAKVQEHILQRACLIEAASILRSKIEIQNMFRIAKEELENVQKMYSEGRTEELKLLLLKELGYEPPPEGSAMIDCDISKLE
jgi:hypothetical protein